jgi:hypothetical protein
MDWMKEFTGMTPDRGEDWLALTRRHNITCDCERGLRAASGITWQRLALLAAGMAADLGQDYFDPTRAIIAAYLRHTGRRDEAAEVEAIGCNEPPPPTSFGSLSPAEIADLKNALRS